MVVPVAMLLICRVAWGVCSRMNLVWGNMHCKCLEMRDVMSAACPPRIQKKNHGERDHRCDKNVSLRIWVRGSMGALWSSPATFLLAWKLKVYYFLKYSVREQKNRFSGDRSISWYNLKKGKFGNTYQNKPFSESKKMHKEVSKNIYVTRIFSAE